MLCKEAPIESSPSFSSAGINQSHLDWQKSSTSQKTSMSRSNMVISPGVVGSAYLSKIFDSEPVIATKLIIGVILTTSIFDSP
jgi:hypothetical protein